MDDKKTVLLSEVSNTEQTTYVEENTKRIINHSPIWKSPKFIIAAVLCLIAVITTITIIISSAGGEDDDIAYKLETARKYLTEMKYEEAKAVYEEIIAADPKCEEAYIGLADAYVGLGDEDKAAEVLEKAMDEIGETYELKKKFKEIEKKREDEDEDKNKEIETTEEVTEKTAIETEGETTTEDNASMEEQEATVDSSTTAIEDTTTVKQEIVINQPQPTTKRQQETTGQLETETQKQTTIQSQPESIHHSIDEQNKIIDMYAEAICKICDGGYTFGVDSIEAQDITGDGIDDLYVTFTVGRGTDSYWLVYANSSIQELGGKVNAAGRYYFEYYRNNSDKSLRAIQVVYGTNPITSDTFEYYYVEDYRTDSTASDITEYLSVTQELKKKLTDGYIQIEIEHEEAINVGISDMDCSATAFAPKIKEVWSYE